MGVILFGIGLLGEYIGRIFQQVRARPRYVVQTILQRPDAQPCQHAEPKVSLEKRLVIRNHE
jgi:undecaprenyl-phosphate 4-deoxy-4-formamido-L-arabinose transferase